MAGFLGMFLMGCLHTRIEHRPTYPDLEQPREPMLLSFEGGHERFSNIAKPKTSPGIMTLTIQDISVSKNGHVSLTTSPEFLCNEAEFIHREQVVHVKRELSTVGKVVLTSGLISLGVGGIWAGVTGADYAQLPPPSPVAGPGERRQDSTIQLAIPLTVAGVGAALSVWPALELISTNEHSAAKARMRLTGKAKPCTKPPKRPKWTLGVKQRNDGPRMQYTELAFNGRLIKLSSPILAPLPRVVDHTDLFLNPVSCLAVSPSVGEYIYWKPFSNARISTLRDKVCFQWATYPATAHLVKPWRIARVGQFVKTRLVKNIASLIRFMRRGPQGYTCNPTDDLYCSHPFSENSVVAESLKAWATQKYPRQTTPADHGFVGEGAIRQIAWNHTQAVKKASKIKTLSWFLKAFPAPTGTYHKAADNELWKHSKGSSQTIRDYRALLPRGQNISKINTALGNALLREKDYRTFLQELSGHPKWSTARKKHLAELGRDVKQHLRNKDFYDARRVLRNVALDDDDKGLRALHKKIDKAEAAEERREEARQRREEAKERRAARDDDDDYGSGGSDMESCCSRCGGTYVQSHDACMRANGTCIFCCTRNYPSNAAACRRWE